MNANPSALERMRTDLVHPVIDSDGQKMHVPFSLTMRKRSGSGRCHRRVHYPMTSPSN